MNFFDEHSPYLRHPLLTEERTASEVDHLTALLGLAPERRLLDIGCAFGRHAVEFARRGVSVTGVDPSDAMLAVAAERAAGLDVAFVSSIGEADGIFDAAIAMFTTLGQVDGNGDTNEDIVAEAGAKLRPGGGLVIEVPQRGPAVDALVASDRFTVGSVTTAIERSFDADTSRVVERFVVSDDSGARPIERVFDLSYRLFDQAELVTLVLESGFADLRIAGSLDALRGDTPARLDDTDPSMVLVAFTPA